MIYEECYQESAMMYDSETSSYDFDVVSHNTDFIERIKGVSSMDALTIANWFIRHDVIADKFVCTDGITNMKLQKLLYYAQGYTLAVRGHSLFDDSLVARKYGPVVDNVYVTFKDYGKNPLFTDVPKFNFDNDTEDILLYVYNQYAKYSAWDLSNMTHDEVPWRAVHLGEVIKLDIIQRYFINKHKEEFLKSDLYDNLKLLHEIQDLKPNWDNEGALAFSTEFVNEIACLISVLTHQPDIGPTGRGSVDLEYGSVVSANKYMDIEIWETDRHVDLFLSVDGEHCAQEQISMEDINERVQQFYSTI